MVLLNNEDEEDIFVHHSEISGSGFISLSEGDCVTFDIGQGEKGLAAQNVKKM